MGAGGTSGLVGAGVDEPAGAVSTGRGLSDVGEADGAGALGRVVFGGGVPGATLDLGSGKTCVGCAAGSVGDWAMMGKVDCDEKEETEFCCGNGSAATASGVLALRSKVLDSEIVWAARGVATPAKIDSVSAVRKSVNE